MRQKITKGLVFFILYASGVLTMNSQVLGGNIELQRNLNTVSVKARVLFRCCPPPAINHLKINWGDGSPPDSIPLLGGFLTNLSTVYCMTFVGSHTFSPGGIYTITAGGDLSLAPGFQNIPNSSVKKLILRGMVNLQIFAHPPVSFATAMGDTVNCNVPNYNGYYSNPTMQSADGDSLAYSIDLHPEIPGYLAPPIGLVSPLGTGLISFTANASGDYNVSYRTDAWRKNATGIYDLITGTSFLELYITVCNVNTPGVTAGIELENGNGELSFFPNPVKDKLTIECGDSIIYVITVTNTLGQIVYVNSKPKSKEEIDLSFLRNGIYYLITKLDAGQKTFKIVKE